MASMLTVVFAQLLPHLPIETCAGMSQLFLLPNLLMNRLSTKGAHNSLQEKG